MADTSRDESIADCSPLSQACIKALTDRIDGKRKFAANEIEKMTVEFALSSNLTMVNRLIIVLGRKFCLSHHQNTRKGGLLGLAAVMVGFNNGSNSKPPPEMVEEVVRPILTCLLDSDPRVRYYACEALYNVTKVAEANILPQFEPIFDGLCRIVADPDLNVRATSETLDRLLKDIVVGQTSFENIENFITRLEEYIYTKNPFTRLFIISWIRLFDAKIDLIKYLPQLLDGILNCLYDSTEEVRASTLALLSEFLNKIVTRPTDQINMASSMSTLLKHARNEQEGPVQYTAIAWIRQLIRLMDGPDLFNFTPGILSAILPCLAFQSGDASIASGGVGGTLGLNTATSSQLFHSIPQASSQGNICEISTLVNSSLLEQVTTVLNERRNIASGHSETINGDLEAILDVLAKELLKQEHPVIKLAILDWFKALKKADGELYTSSNTSHQKLLQTLLDTLSARSDAVVKNALRVITEIFCDDTNDDHHQQQAQLLANNFDEHLTVGGGGKLEDETSELEKKRSPSSRSLSNQQQQQDKSQQQSNKIGGASSASTTSATKRVAITTGDHSHAPLMSSQQQSVSNITRFIQALCKKFRENETIFEERGTFIILNLCSMIKPELVYKSFADILKDERSNMKFAYNLVQKLNQILLTTQPLFGLRSRLGGDDDETEMVALFNTLYFAWCHSPIAAITLCLLTKNYRHANEIVTALSKTDINVDTLTQIDWVVQLIESPIFASLRMRLLDTSSNQYLIQSLYGLLMILPQSEAYRKLSHRLDQVCKFMIAQPHFRLPSGGAPSSVTTSAVSGSTTTSVGAAAGQSQSKSTSSAASKDQTKKANPAMSVESLMRHFHHIQSLRAKSSRAGDFEE